MKTIHVDSFRTDCKNIIEAEKRGNLILIDEVAFKDAVQFIKNNLTEKAYEKLTEQFNFDLIAVDTQQEA